MSTTSLSTCTPVRASSCPSTRPLLMSSSQGDLPCADPSNVFFGPMAEMHSLAGHEPKDLTGESNSILVKPMFFRSSMTSTCDPAESIATPLPESDLDDEQKRNTLASLLYLQERSKYRPITSLSLFQRKLRVKLISLPRKCRETFRQCSHTKESRVKKHFSTEGISSGRQPVQGKCENFLQVL